MDFNKLLAATKNKGLLLKSIPSSPSGGQVSLTAPELKPTVVSLTLTNRQVANRPLGEWKVLYQRK